MKKPFITGDTIVIPSSTEYLQDVDSFLEGVLRGYGATESTIADIAISASELVNNAIVHGNRADGERSVTVRIRNVDGRVSIAVTDQGGGFDPTHIANPVADENLLREVGRGIFIVRALMDSVDIEPGADGTTIIITKSI